MPTNQNVYNTRLTDEALEKRFRDTFRSQGGAELVDDLYASGVIIPVVDFTQAAEGSQLPENLQTAWDFSTTSVVARNQTLTVVSTPGFWRIQGVATLEPGGALHNAYISLNDGLSNRVVWSIYEYATGSTGPTQAQFDFVAFLRTGDDLLAFSADTTIGLSVHVRQIADVSGNLNNPSGFSSS